MIRAINSSDKKTNFSGTAVFQKGTRLTKEMREIISQIKKVAPEKAYYNNRFATVYGKKYGVLIVPDSFVEDGLNIQNINEAFERFLDKNRGTINIKKKENWNATAETFKQIKETIKLFLDIDAMS